MALLYTEARSLAGRLSPRAERENGLVSLGCGVKVRRVEVHPPAAPSKTGLRAVLGAHRWALLLFLVGAVVHLVRLDVWPAPAGDEVNWFEMAEDAHAGGSPQLQGIAGFASTLFARLVAVGFVGGKIDWWHARLPLALSVLILAALSYGVLFRAGRSRAGLFFMAWQLFSPWALVWSRTVSVSYAIMSGLGALGTLVFWIALDEKRATPRTLGLVIGSQLLMLDLYLSPFACAPLVASALVLLMHPARRSILRSPGPWLSLAFAAVEVFPMARAASGVAGLHGYTWAQISENAASRSLLFLRAIVDGLDGTATLQHFLWCTSATPVFSAVILFMARMSVLVIGALVLRAAVRGAARAEEPWAMRAVLTVAVALLTTPVLLAPARDWSMPTIDSDRYAFAWSMPAGMLVALVTSRGARLERVLSRAAMLAWVVLPGAALVVMAYLGPGPDCGVDRDGGGAWRGWRSVAGPKALPDWLADESMRAAEGGDAVLVIDDFFSLRAVQVSLRLRGARVKLLWPEHDAQQEPMLPSGRLLVALWPPSLFPQERPEGTEGPSMRLREIVEKRGGRRVAEATAQNGRPVLELWVLDAAAP